MSARWCLPGLVLGVLGAAGVAGAAPPADGPAALAELRAIRDALVKQWQTRAEADTKAGASADLRVVLPDAADGDDVVLHLHQRGGRWVRAGATVPAWRQETFQEQWAATFYNGATTVPFDRRRYPVDASGLTFDGRTLRGLVKVDLPLDELKSERFAPGRNWTGLDKVSWYDRFAVVSRHRSRPQTYTLDASVGSARMYDLVLERGLEGRPILVDFTWPATPWTHPHAATPTYNGGHHRAVVEAWQEQGGKVSGTLRLALLPDNWFPKDPTPRAQTVTVEGTVAQGRVSGSYRSTGALGEAAGPVSGASGLMLAGRYKGEGELGPCQGRIDGFVAVRDAAETLPEPAGSVAEQAATLNHQVRALALALSRPTLTLDEALVWTAGPTPAVTDADAATLAKFLERSVAVARAARQAVADPAASPAATTATVPTGDATPLAAGADGAWQLPADGAGKSFVVPQWQVLGPLPQAGPDAGADVRIPDLVALPGVPVAFDAEGLAGRGASPPAKPPLTWTAVSSDGDLLAFPVDRRPLFFRFSGAVWYAAADLHTDKETAVDLAAAGNDRVTVWVNDALVLSGPERPWASRNCGLLAARVRLAAGVNRVLVRVRTDRKEPWLRLVIREPGATVAARPPASQPAATAITGYRNDGTGCYPSAEPPLAWDLEKGINVLWRTPLADTGGLPIVAAGRVFVNAAPNTLVCLDVLTGKELWRRATAAPTPDAKGPSPTAKGKGMTALQFGPARSTPVSDGRHVWVHYANGVAACYDLDGQPRWITPTPPGAAAVRLIAGRLIVEGVAAEADKGKGKDKVQNHLVLALDAETGEKRWSQVVPGSFDAESTVALSLPSADGALPVVVTSAGQVLSAADGAVLRSSLGAVWPRPADVVPSGDRLFFTTQGRRVAVALTALDRTTVSTDWLWESNYEIGGFGNFPVPAVVVDGRLYTYGPVQERGPHCPVPLVELNVLDAATGRTEARIKPVFIKDAWNHDLPPALAGGYVFVGDAGGGAFSKMQTHGQVAAIRTGPDPYVVCRNLVELGTTAPVFDGPRMVLRSSQSVMCVAVTTDAGRRYQQERVAEQVLQDVGVPPTPGKVRAVAPLADVPADGVPVTRLAPGRPVGQWLVAAGLPAGEVAASDLRPVVGTPLTVGGVTRPFEPYSVGPPTVIWPHDGVIFYLQGRGIAYPTYVGGAPRSAVCGPAGDGVGYLYTVLDNTQPQVAQLAVDAAGLSAWLNGQPLRPGEPVRLEPGLYGLLLRVEPAFYVRPWERKLDVAKALAAGALRDIEWPKAWTVFGPIPDVATPLDADQLRAMPGTLTLDGVTYEPRTLTAANGLVDLASLIGPPPDRSGARDSTNPAGKDFLGRMAYAFAEINVPADGRLLINATADWYMAWYLDGQRVYSSLEKGNGTASTNLLAHTVGVPVTRGKHVLAVLVKPGNKGWSFGSVGGWTDQPAGLEPYRLTPPGRAGKLSGNAAAGEDIRERVLAAQAAAASAPADRDPDAPPPVVLSPAFREVEDPAALEAAWRHRARQRKADLEQIARDLADSPAGQTAKAYLAR